MAPPNVVTVTVKTPGELSDLPYADLLQPHEGGGLAIEARYDTVHFDRADFEDEDAGGASFLECAITDSSFSGVNLRRARLNDVWLSGDRFVAVRLAESSWQDVTAGSCVLAGVEAFGAVLRRVVFRSCKLDSVNLRAAALHEVVFEDCVLRDVDLGGAKLNGVSFPGSALERIRLGKAVLKRTDLRGATVLDIAEGYESLGGAVIDTGQLLELAPALAANLGITVKDG